MQKAVFIDRDGTLVEEVNYLSRLEDLRTFHFTKPALEMLKRAGYRIVVVTNQSGIGRGIYTEAAMHAIHGQIQTDLAGMIDKFYFCPHLPDAGCRCRKPGLGMIEAACSDLDIALEGSWMIGDKRLDIETGFNAGVGTALVLTGYGTKHLPEMSRQPEIIADDLMGAVRELLIRSEDRARSQPAEPR